MVIQPKFFNEHLIYDFFQRTLKIYKNLHGNISQCPFLIKLHEGEKRPKEKQ